MAIAWKAQERAYGSLSEIARVITDPCVDWHRLLRPQATKKQRFERVHPEGGDIALKAIRQAHLWLGLLTSGKAAGFAEIARREKTDTRFVARTIRFAFLAPEIVAQSLNADQPLNLQIGRITPDKTFPILWEDQNNLILK